jgi:hypothetical protein
MPQRNREAAAKPDRIPRNLSDIIPLRMSWWETWFGEEYLEL